MKAKKQNPSRHFFFIGLLFVCSFFTLLFAPTASASAEAEKKASEECSEINGTDQLATARRAACAKGFIAGYDGGKKDTACKGLTGTPKNNCSDGFDAGVAAKEKAPERDGREGAATKTKSKTDSCKKYNNADNKALCGRAYDNQIVAMAQIDGRNAGRAGQASPCDSLGYGGAAAKTACKSSYSKGKNEAGRSPRSKCGGVETYFNFEGICSGTDKNAGGNESPIIRIGLAVVGWVTALVAVAVVGGVMYGGFLYLTARDNTGQTEKGVTVITNSVVALIAWGVAYALINFLVPGGLFNG